MAIQRISRSFKDISLSFEPHPVTKDLPVLKNENAIRRSVRNIVETIPTERFFNSLLGSDIERSLFEFVDFGTASVIQNQIEISINNFEPRVTMIDVTVSSDIDNNGFNVRLQYVIKNRNMPIDTTLFLERIR